MARDASPAASPLPRSPLSHSLSGFSLGARAAHQRDSAEWDAPHYMPAQRNSVAGPDIFLDTSCSDLFAPMDPPGVPHASARWAEKQLTLPQSFVFLHPPQESPPASDASPVGPGGMVRNLSGGSEQEPRRELGGRLQEDDEDASVLRKPVPRMDFHNVDFGEKPKPMLPLSQLPASSLRTASGREVPADRVAAHALGSAPVGAGQRDKVAVEQALGTAPVGVGQKDLEWRSQGWGPPKTYEELILNYFEKASKEAAAAEQETERVVPLADQVPVVVRAPGAANGPLPKAKVRAKPRRPPEQAAGAPGNQKHGELNSQLLVTRIIQMGFSEREAREAARRVSTVEAAVDWILGRANA